LGIGEYLTNNVSRSIVYALLLQQPLTRDEIETSPVRATMRALAYQGEKSTHKEPDVAHLRTLLAKGTECGILHGYKSGGKNYYFLNSDLRLTPKPITSILDETKTISIDVAVDQRVGEILGETALLPNTRAASSSEIPIPHIESEKKLVLWLSWLTTPIRRDILSLVAQKGRISRPDLRRQLGFWADRLAVYEGVATSILSLDADKNLSFQFASVNLPEHRESSREIRWIERPPSFMLSRSYEPLTCIQGGSMAAEELKSRRASPMIGLAELESHGKEIVPHKRRRTIGSNFLQMAHMYGVFDMIPKFRNISSSTLKPIPDRVVLNNAISPFIWINETRAEIPVEMPKLPTGGGRIIALRKPGLEARENPLMLARKQNSERIQNQIEKVERRLSDFQQRKPIAADLTGNAPRFNFTETTRRTTDFHPNQRAHVASVDKAPIYEEDKGS
jgi:hypothetical protein